MYLLGFLLMLLMVLPSLSFNGSNSSEVKVAIGNAIILSLNRLIFYYEKNYKSFALESLTGIMVLQEELNGVLRKWKKDPDLKPLMKDIHEILKRSSTVSPKNKIHIKVNNNKNAKDFLQTLEAGFWKLPLSWTKINKSLVFSHQDDGGLFPNNLSDLCLIRLLGKKVEGVLPCNVTHMCEGVMTNLGRKEGPLLRQLIYFLVARMKNCTDGPFLRSQYYIDTFCANMMKSNLEEEKNGFPFYQNSHFLLNTMFCGLGGYSEFYKIRWIQNILNQQNDEKGCFLKIYDLGDASVLTDNWYKGSCSPLETGTGAAVLGGFLYYLTDYTPKQLLSHH